MCLMKKYYLKLSFSYQFKVTISRMAQLNLMNILRKCFQVEYHYIPFIYTMKKRTIFKVEISFLRQSKTGLLKHKLFP